MPLRSVTHPYFALSASVLLLCSAGFAMAAAGRPVGGIGALTVPVERSLVWVGTPSQDRPFAFSISSESMNAPTPDSFQIDYHQGTFNLDYQPSPPQAPMGHISLTFQSLVEWDPTASDGRLDGNSTLQSFGLASAGFGKIPVQHSVALTSDGGEIQSFVIPSDTNEVVLNLTIAERFISLQNGETLTPMEAKLSIEIHHVMSHADARLGLLLNIQSTGAVPRFQDTSWDDEHEFSHGDQSVNVTNESNGHMSTVFFAWQTHASVNGADSPVNVTGPEENESAPGNYGLYMAYGGAAVANGTSITVVHDPDLGVVSAAYESLVNLPPAQPPLQGDYLVYAVTVGAVAALVLATVVLGSRRRRGKQE